MSEVEYILVATVDGEEVYSQSSPLLEVVEQSLLTAGNAVEKKLEQQVAELKEAQAILEDQAESQ